MNGLYAVKVNRDRSVGIRYWGGEGNMGPMPWKELVGLIAKAGIKAVEKIRHADKDPKNYHQLNRKEMLELWKVVEAKRNSN
jgi:hypothetical protein